MVGKRSVGKKIILLTDEYSKYIWGGRKFLKFFRSIRNKMIKIFLPSNSLNTFKLVND